MPTGEYALIQKGKGKQEHQYLYRLSHPLGEYVLDEARRDSRLAQSLEEQKAAEEILKKLNRLQRRKREQIFDVQDEIDDKLDVIISVG